MLYIVHLLHILLYHLVTFKIQVITIRDILTIRHIRRIPGRSSSHFLTAFCESELQATVSGAALYEDTRKPLNDFEITFWSTQCSLTLARVNHLCATYNDLTLSNSFFFLLELFHKHTKLRQLELDEL